MCYISLFLNPTTHVRLLDLASHGSLNFSPGFGIAAPSFEWPISAFFSFFLKSLGICPFVPEQRAHLRRWGSARLCPGREPIFDQAFQPPTDFAVDWGRDISVTTTFQSIRLFSLQFPL